MSSAAYTELCGLLAKAAHLDAIAQLAGWDQETYMPGGGAAGRSEQAALIAGIVHERKTAKKLGELIGTCERNNALLKDEAIAANLREMRRDYDIATKLPGELVEELAKVSSQALDAWKKARAASDFEAFRPLLEKMLELTRRKAECLGTKPGGEPYDALLDLYEPGATAAEIESVFTPLRTDLAALIADVRENGGKVSTKCLKGTYAPEDQHKLGLAVLKAMTFDLEAGRLDTTAHPFCSGIAPGDTRLTTRYKGEKFTDALYSTMHEAGHGLYEQGLPKLDANGGVNALYGTPLAESVSLGIHESQSRMWENFVGRSRSFWKWLAPRAKKHLGKAIEKHSAKEYYVAVNTVTPSLIRVEADEGTYNLHVMIRFEIERALLRDDMKAKDIPAEWNRRYAEYLGVEVPDDRHGCLQDVHWSMGLIGYFPTYTLGNLYAAQFWEAANEQMPDLDKQIGKGEFGGLREWLRTNIHQHGRRYRAAELCQRITGQPLKADALLRHLRGRAEQVYGL